MIRSESEKIQEELIYFEWKNRLEKKYDFRPFWKRYFCCWLK